MYAQLIANSGVDQSCFLSAIEPVPRCVLAEITSLLCSGARCHMWSSQTRAQRPLTWWPASPRPSILNCSPPNPNLLCFLLQTGPCCVTRKTQTDDELQRWSSAHPTSMVIRPPCQSKDQDISRILMEVHCVSTNGQ